LTVTFDNDLRGLMTAVPIADRLDIQELVALYTFRTDTRDFGSIPELFAADGVWDETVLGAPLCDGRDAISAAFTALAAADVGYVVHINGAHHISAFTGETASGTSHLHAELMVGGDRMTVLGYYRDEYVKVDGAWRFSLRKLEALAPVAGLPAQPGIDFAGAQAER
jgi:hypothetical protein